MGARRRSLFVGYAQSGLKLGATMATPQFIPVNGNAIALESILPTGDGVSDVINIQTLDAFGYTVDSYLWINWAGASYDQEAWVNPDTYEIVEGVTFDPGQGLWITGSSSEQSVRFPAPEL